MFTLHVYTDYKVCATMNIFISFRVACDLITNFLPPTRVYACTLVARPVNAGAEPDLGIASFWVPITFLPLHVCSNTIAKLLLGPDCLVWHNTPGP